MAEEDGGEGGQAGRSALVLLRSSIMFDSLLFQSFVLFGEIKTILQGVIDLSCQWNVETKPNLCHLTSH